MNSNPDLLLRYISSAPLSLAVERYLECLQYQSQPFHPPVLDLGCGDGLFAEMMHDRKIDTGIDLNSKELSRAGKRKKYHELICCPGDAVPKPDGYFSTIFSNSVLEHVDDIEPIFCEAYRLLHKGGHMYISVPSEYFEQYTIIYRILAFFRLETWGMLYRNFCNNIIWKQKHHYHRKKWEEIAVKCGFTVEASYSFNPKAICLINSLLYPFGIIGLVNKKIFDRWVVFPSLKRFWIYPVYIIIRAIIRNKTDSSEKGGLIFLALKKNDQP